MVKLVHRLLALMSVPKVFLLFGLTLAVGSLLGQDVSKLYGEAEAFFYNERFGEALPIYEKVIESDPDFEDTLYKLEICRLLSDRQYTDMSTFNSFGERMQQNDKFIFIGREGCNWRNINLKKPSNRFRFF